MVSTSNLGANTQRLAAGGGQLEGLRAAAGKDPKGAIRAVAQQFEALFMQELMKSMRATTMSSGMLDNNGSEMATGLLDQQYASEMSGKPGGLADAIVRQLERQMGIDGGVGSTGTGQRNGAPGAAASGGLPLPARTTSVGSAAAAARYAQVDASAAPAGGKGAPADFVQAHAEAAEAVAAESGIPARFMIAQAAHETGWGRRQIVGSDGRASNNLFGIKAGASWDGPTVTATTTEVIDGQPRKVQARFRAYASAEESFRDYARLIGNSPRYAAVRAAGGDAQAFASGLQRAGYATDPQYAAKLGRVIETTERVQRGLQASAGGAGLRTSA